jgi:hypothetical protein
MQLENRRAEYRSDVISEADEVFNNESAQKQSQMQQFKKNLPFAKCHNNIDVLRRQQSNRSLESLSRGINERHMETMALQFEEEKEQNCQEAKETARQRQEVAKQQQQQSTSSAQQQNNIGQQQQQNAVQVQSTVLPQPQQQQQFAQLSEELKAMNIKRGRLIQLINYLTPIGTADYPIIVERVLAMAEPQLDSTYAELYKKFTAKAEEEKQTAKKLGLQTPTMAMPN